MPRKAKPSPPPLSDRLQDLQSYWKILYTQRLPHLARSKDPAQPKWPVHNDHCFARIILDNAVGETRPWTEVVRAPAWKNMTREQLEAAVALGEKIAEGQVGLVGLDERSLMLRGKSGKQKKEAGETSKDEEEEEAKGRDGEMKTSSSSDKRKRTRGQVQLNGTISKYFLPSPQKKQKTQTTQRPKSSEDIPPSSPETSPKPTKKQKSSPPILADQSPTAAQVATFISDQNPRDLLASTSIPLTAFRRKVLKILCDVPRGRWTTYAGISDYITALGHFNRPRDPGPGATAAERKKYIDRFTYECSARAVGNALRNNPFAPLVPCHRVLATGGKIGGFGGEWGIEGKHAREKMELLRSEGVRFDGKGRALGLEFGQWPLESGCDPYS